MKFLFISFYQLYYVLHLQEYLYLIFGTVFFNFFTNEFIIGFVNDAISGITGGPNMNPPNCTILEFLKILY